MIAFLHANNEQVEYEIKNNNIYISKNEIIRHECNSMYKTNVRKTIKL